MAKKIEKCGIKREKGWLYFLDKKGNVSRAKMVQGRKKGKQKQEVLVKCGIKREPGMLYFIDKDGDVAMTQMARR
jgi:hypothetical protein